LQRSVPFAILVDRRELDAAAAFLADEDTTAAFLYSGWCQAALPHKRLGDTQGWTDFCLNETQRQIAACRAASRLAEAFHSDPAPGDSAGRLISAAQSEIRAIFTYPHNASCPAAAWISVQHAIQPSGGSNGTFVETFFHSDWNRSFYVLDTRAQLTLEQMHNHSPRRSPMSLPPNHFFESIITFLMPYFSIHASDVRGVRSEIIDTLASYATRTRAEMLQAAQIIALGMTTLDVLAEAKTAEMSQSMRIRYRGCANGLNRSVLNTEKALDRRLDCDLPPPEPVPEPVNDVPDVDMQIAMEQARAAIEAHRNSRHPVSDAPKTPVKTSVKTPHPTPPQEQNQALWSSTMVDALAQIGLPNGPTPLG
jgi:hypothetical protein